MSAEVHEEIKHQGADASVEFQLYYTDKHLHALTTQVHNQHLIPVAAYSYSRPIHVGGNVFIYSQNLTKLHCTAALNCAAGFSCFQLVDTLCLGHLMEC